MRRTKTKRPALTLSAEKVRQLQTDQLVQVAAGYYRPPPEKLCDGSSFKCPP
jgi:hypothetical protein